VQQNVDFATVVGNTFFNLSFSGILLLLALCVIVAVWCVVPFSVFGLKARLDSIELAQRSQTELLVSELKRLNEMLRMRLNGEAAVSATGVMRRPDVTPAATGTPVPEAMRRAAMQIEAEPVPAPQPIRFQAPAPVEAPVASKRPPTLHPVRRHATASAPQMAAVREEIEEAAPTRTLAGQMRTMAPAVRQQSEPRGQMNATFIRHPAAARGAVQTARRPAPQFMQDLNADEDWGQRASGQRTA